MQRSCGRKSGSEFKLNNTRYCLKKDLSDDEIINLDYNNYDQSLIYYKLAIRIKPGFYYSYSNLAKVFMDNGDYKNSLK